MAGFLKSIFAKISNKAEIDWDQLEADLIRADLGPRTALEIVAELQDLGRKVTADDVIATARTNIARHFPEEDFQLPLPQDGRPVVILVMGVNGTGKTTSSAKLAKHLEDRGHRVLLAAADTFRAAAVEQLERWAERLNIALVKGLPNADPSSVCYTAHRRAVAEGFDYLICDTAGRLHTRNNLMEELTKICRTLAKQDAAAPHVSFLVVDATTGSNALVQAQEFHKATPLDALIMTKLDGSGKGGIAVRIQQEVGIPPAFIGTGEEPDAFAPFSKERYLENLL